MSDITLRKTLAGLGISLLICLISLSLCFTFNSKSPSMYTASCFALSYAAYVRIAVNTNDFGLKLKLYNWANLSLEEINTGTWPSWLGENTFT
jgi:hypothetical protein